MRKTRRVWIGAVLFLALSATAHGVYLAEWLRGNFMVGFNDGLSQMVPFKQLLYDMYSSGEFFYSPEFGLGAGTYSGLAYYFSTSVVFLLSAAAVFLLETIGAVQGPDALFWAQSAVFVSIARLAAVFAIAFGVFRYMKFARLPALLGACVYGLSGMYFRHAVYWEFFADAYLWLPLLIFGVEKIIREGRAGWFLAAVAVSMFDNFYFAYINFLVVAIYTGFRLFIPLADGEIRRGPAVRKLLAAGLIGAAVSAVSFVPAVYAFLNNHRPPYMQEIGWFDLHDSVLTISRYLMLPAAFVLFAFIPSLYRDRRFRLFALVTLVGVVLHYSPKAASVFNGLSAPQYRWEYFLAFTSGGAVAAAFSRLRDLKVRQVVIAAGGALIAYALFAFIGPWRPDAVLAIVVAAVVLFVLIARAVKDRRKAWQPAAFIVLFLIAYVNVYQLQILEFAGSERESSEAYITGPDYDDPEIRRLLDGIRDRSDGFAGRVSWMEGVRNNTPIVQDFRGVSAYSSILNKELLFFYWEDLEIDMKRESVSRYATLGRRANLHSLLGVNWLIAKPGDRNIPHGFEEVVKGAEYSAFQNRHPLPFVRSASKVYSEEALEGAPVLAREHAMLTGVVLDGHSSKEVPDLEAREFELDTVKSSYEDGILQVTGKTGGLDLHLDGKIGADSDLYISFHLERQEPVGGFRLQVNNYRTSRKSSESIYRTFADDLTIRVPGENVVRLRVPEGVYELSELAVYEETYGVLREEVEKAAGQVGATNRSEATEAAEISQVKTTAESTETGWSEENVNWQGSKLTAEFWNEENDAYLIMPVPYETGWRAKVNGKAVDVLKANYAFIAVPAESGKNVVKLTYRPPYFILSLAISLAALLVAGVYVGRQRRGESRAIEGE